MRLLCLFFTSLVSTRADLGLYSNLNFGTRNGLGEIQRQIPNQITNFVNRVQDLNAKVLNEEIIRGNQFRGISNFRNTQNVLNGLRERVQLNGQLEGLNKIENRLRFNQISPLQFRAQVPNLNVNAQSGFQTGLHQIPGVHFNNQGLGLQAVSGQRYGIQKPLVTFAPVSITPQSNSPINPIYTRVNQPLLSQANPIGQLSNLAQEGHSLNTLAGVNTNFGSIPSYALRSPFEQQFGRTQILQTTQNPLGLYGNTVNPHPQVGGPLNPINTLNNPQLNNNMVRGLHNPFPAINNILKQNPDINNRNLINNPLSNAFTPFNRGFANSNQPGSVQQNKFHAAFNPINRFQMNSLMGNNQASVGAYPHNVDLMNKGQMNQVHNQMANPGQHFINNHHGLGLQAKDISQNVTLHNKSAAINSQLINCTCSNHLTNQVHSSSNATTLHHQIPSNSSSATTKSSATNATLSTVVNATAVPPQIHNLTDNSAVLTDDGSNLKRHLIEINSTQEVLSKWDSIVKDKGEKNQLNLTRFAKKDPFCSCNGTASCNCCVSLDLAVIKKDVCLEVADTASGNGTQMSLIMDGKRQEFSKYSGNLTDSAFNLQGLASGNITITTPALSNDTSLQNFCASTSINLFSLNFTALPLGCFSSGNHSISIIKHI